MAETGVKMYNPFIQRIGIWYTYEDEPMMLHIMNHISAWCSDYIEHEQNSRFDRAIYLKDGTWIKAIPANENIRGQRLTSSFVIKPEHISRKIIDCVIRPITSCGAGCVCELDSDYDEELWNQLWYRRFIL